MIVSFQGSFVSLVSGNLNINLIPLAVLAWVAIAGFEKIWPWIVTLGIFSDLFSFEKVGVNVISFIFLAYLMSFFSRRFLIEKKLAGMIVITFFIFAGFPFLDLGRIFFRENFSIYETYLMAKNDFSAWNDILLQGAVNILLFYPVYVLLNKVERNIEKYENKIKVFS
jgi:cell shape-determining protein MreD